MLFNTVRFHRVYFVAVLTISSAWAGVVLRWDGRTGPVGGQLVLSASDRREVSLVRVETPSHGEDLTVRFVQPGRIAFSFTRDNRRLVESAPVEFGAGSNHAVVLSLGSLMPPLRSKFYWENPGLVHLTQQLLVMLDGRVVISRPVSFEPMADAKVTFAGKELVQIVPVGVAEIAEKVLPLMAQTVLRDPSWHSYPGPVRLKLIPDSDASPGVQPLLSTGRLGAGDLVYWRALSGRSVRIGFRHASGVTIESEPLPLREGVQDLLISTGGLLPPANDELAGREPLVERLRGIVFVELNGRVALSARTNTHASTTENIVFGADVVEPWPLVRYFEGRAESLVGVAPDEVILADASVAGRTGSPSAAWAGWPGPIRIRLKFPAGRTGIAEPVLCSGRTGAADLVYVRYEDERHVRLAFDHWGVGGGVSDPIEIDPAAVQEIIVSEGALFPPLESGLFVQQPSLRLRKSEISIVLNGRVVLSGPASTHPSTPQNIFFGRNRVGASSCVPEFSGTLVDIQLAPEAWPAASGK